MGCPVPRGAEPQRQRQLQRSCLLPRAAEAQLPALARVPRVFMDADPVLGERDNVLLDSTSVAKCAADCLVPLGCASYAYVGVPDRPFWCLLREAAFVKELRSRGIALCAFGLGIRLCCVWMFEATTRRKTASRAYLKL